MFPEMGMATLIPTISNNPPQIITVVGVANLSQNTTSTGYTMLGFVQLATVTL